ncbi:MULTISPECIES: phage major capsid protein, P2 family [unclassified Halomonas]|uniref:phage major capsid protein, P2 family n=1 Tax=unclassified Halomonas TaxID=2609666 RepID=UPI000C64273B|nr:MULTISPECIES: phage major capsid protein, P2 family [unclassified Halomonas]MAR71162.1 phage major capsid protein, P2 family [Halomonas sp.]MAY71437.1 phage major capsid protein, P2 family [Halomonas sp.]MBY5940242.1 phage major capsid protein, P2 family [Halomonas sp. DP5N14-9]|tara:strand:- start:1162 stop:2178 length:1017 start_codon:yes stop_codon:yes gene_type:complete
MRNETRIAYHKLLKRVAELNGVPNATESFAVEPSVQQTLESRIQESSEFLSSINVIGVDELKGEKLGLGISGPIAGRTDVSQNDRQPRDLVSLDANGYECLSTEFDTYLTWSTLDAWAKFPDFQARVRNAVIRQQSLDRIMIGLNGTSAAAETNRVANPMLQDVNKGWLQQYREHAPARVMSEGANTGEIRVGKNGDYENLDALVYDVVSELIDPWHRESTAIRAICGRKMLADKYFPLINQNQPPTEQRALDMIVSQKRMGGQQAARVPYMPDGSLLITMPENLSIYWQRGSRRRNLEDNPKRKRVENYESSNDAYVVEDFGAGCLVENIVFGDWTV